MATKSITTATLLLASLLPSCERSSAQWQKVESERLGLAVYLDTNSVERRGSLIMFWTRLSSTNWLKRMSGGELRTKMQVDCQRMTWRQISGGYFVRGALRYPLKNHLSGDVPKTGYIHALYNDLC